MGDRQISGTFLADLDRKLERAEKLTGAAGMSYGPAGVLLPDLRDDASQLQLIYTPYAPGAFGGFAHSYGELLSGSNQKALDANTIIVKGKNDQNGKLTPTVEAIKMFPAKGWFFDSGTDELRPPNSTADNLPGDTPDTEKVVNPGRLPIMWGYSWCVPAVNDPDTWVIVAPLIDPYAKPFAWFWLPNHQNEDNGICRFNAPRTNSDYGTPLLVLDLWNADHTSLGQQLNDAACYGGFTAFDDNGVPTHSAAGDAIYLNIPGLWEISCSARFSLGSGVAKKKETFNFNAPASGSVDVTLPVPIQVELQIFPNWSGTNAISNEDFYPLSISHPPASGVIHGGSFIEIHQRKFVTGFSLDHPGGASYNRLNMAVRARCCDNVSSLNGTDPMVQIDWAHMMVRPIHSNYSGLMSSGYNPFLGEKNEFNETGFQWWGNGDPPKRFDRHGKNINNDDDGP